MGICLDWKGRKDVGDFLVRKGAEGLENLLPQDIMRSSGHKRGPGRDMLFYKGGYNTKKAYPVWMIVKYNYLPVQSLIY